MWVPLAEPVTGRHDRYRVRATVAGPDRFQAVFVGAPGFYQVTSRIDAVAAVPART